MYFTPVSSSNCAFVMGHSSVRTDIYCICDCFDYPFPDFAEIGRLVHFELVFSSKDAERSRSQLRNCCE